MKTSISKNLVGIILLSITFFYFYGPRLKIIDVHEAFVFFLGLIALIYIVSTAKISKPAAYSINTGILLLLYSTTVILVAKNHDLTFVYIAIRWIFYTLSAYILVCVYQAHYRDHFINVIIKHILIATLVNAIFTIMTMINSDFQQLAFLYLNYEEQEAWINKGHRTVDLTMGGGAQASLVFAMGFILCFLYTLTSLNPMMWVLASLSILGAILFTGRSGQLAVALGLLLIFFRYQLLTKGNIFKNPIAKVIGLYGIAIAICFSILIPALLTNADSREKLEEKFLPWAMEVVQIFDSESEGSATIEKISERMYFLPDDMSQTIFGDGNAGRQELLPYVASDVGYVRSIHAVGIIGTIMLFGFIAISAKFSLKRKNYESLVFFYICLVLIVFNFKEFLPFHKSIGAWFFTFYFLAFSSSRKNVLLVGKK